MKNWKKFFVAAVAVGAVFSTNVAPVERFCPMAT